MVLFSFFAILILRHINLPINNILLQERADFPVHRLLNLLVICTLFGFIIKKIPKGGKIKGFETLGRNSLQVFSFHVMLLYLLQPIGCRIEEYFGYKIFSFYVLFIVFTLFLPIYLVEKIKSTPIREYILKPQS